MGVSACSIERADYDYVYVFDPDPVAVTFGKPKPAAIYFGDPVPISSSYAIGDVLVEVIHEGLTLRVSSVQPIEYLDAGDCATAVKLSATEWLLAWNKSCMKHAIKLSFGEGSGMQYDLRANMVRGGDYYYFDSL